MRYNGGPACPPGIFASRTQSGSSASAGNALLGVLPDQILQNLEVVDLPRGWALSQASGAQRHAYFPTTALIAIVLSTKSGDTAQIAVVGNEGVVGLLPLGGAEGSSYSAVVQMPGRALRLDASLVSLVDEACLSQVPVRRILMRYLQAVVIEISQMVVCNRHHSPEQQLSRMLLLSLDRCGGAELLLTHETLAGLLGLRRESISSAAARLQQAGLIRYTRGHIQVLDVLGLRERSCECYDVVNSEFLAMRSTVWPGIVSGTAV